MKIIKPLFFIIFVLLASCSSNTKQRYKPAPYVNFVHKIEKEFTTYVENKFDLVCIGSGGQMPYDVEMISIDFVAYKRAPIEEARKLEVELTEKFVEVINSNEGIRPYLREYPFTADRARVGISFFTMKNEYYKDNSVSHISHIKNKLYFFNQNERKKGLSVILEEPYEEALKIVIEGIQ